MASANCWRCLSRPTSTLQVTLPRSSTSTTAAFSTSSTVFAAAQTKKSGGSQKPTIRVARTLKIKKKAFVKTGKPPAPGERKAMRKRIVLSNTNALEVPGLRDLDAALIEELLQLNTQKKDGDVTKASGALGGDEGPVGKVVGLDGLTVDSLRAVEAFKTTQGWGNFRRPATLVREETVALVGRLVDAEKKDGALRMVVDGEKGTGKSLMLLQAMATAFTREWIVINIAEAQDLTNANIAYAPIPNTSPTLYSQNTYVANLLTQIGKANLKVLMGLELSQTHDNVPIPLQSNISLARLCELGGRDPDIAWPIFQAFWTEITAEGRPPIMFALDSLSFIMQNSQYRNPQFEQIHSHDLTLVKHFTDVFSGQSKLPNGGAVLAATSRSHAPVSKSVNLMIQQEEDRKAGKALTQREPYDRTYDARAEKVMSGVEVLKIKGLSRKEARGLMEYWAASGVLRSRVDEKKVAESWSLAGNGIVAEIERGALMMRI